MKLAYPDFLQKVLLDKPETKTIDEDGIQTQPDRLDISEALEHRINQKTVRRNA